MILIITLKSETTKEVLREGRAKNTHVHTTHQPKVYTFSDLFQANSFLETSTETILGVYELVRDLTEFLQLEVLPSKGTKEVKQIVIQE